MRRCTVWVTRRLLLNALLSAASPHRFPHVPICIPHHVSGPLRPFTNVAPSLSTLCPAHPLLLSSLGRQQTALEIQSVLPPNNTSPPTSPSHPLTHSSSPW